MYGTIILSAGAEPLHPGRSVRHGLQGQRLQLLQEIGRFQFNLARILGGDPVRSLTLEEGAVSFDIGYRATLKQLYSPLTGRISSRTSPAASFSTPLSRHLDRLENVWVVPGGRTTKLAHRPNENISREQIQERR